MTAIASLRNTQGNCNQRGIPRKNISHFAIVIAFLLGIVFGRLSSSEYSTTNQALVTTSGSISSNSNAISTDPTALKSSVQYLKNTPVRNTVHVDKATGHAITKQQLLDPFVVPNLAGFSVATVPKDQSVEMHSHRSMHEFFYVLEGTADFFLCDEKNDGQQGDWHRVVPGTFVHFVPNCAHSIVVPENGTGDNLKVLIAGVTVGD